MMKKYLLNKVKFPNYFNKFSRYFFNAQVQAPQQATNANIKFEIVLPSLQKKYFELVQTASFKELEAEIKKENKFATVEFKTWDNSIISKNNDIATTLLAGDPIFLKINSMEWQILNAKKFEFTYTENYKLKEDLNQDAQFELRELTKKVNKLNQNKKLNNEEINEISLQIFKIKNYYQNLDSLNLMKNYKNLEELFERYYHLKSEFSRLHSIRKKLLQRCEIKAKTYILLGGLLFIVELILLYYGTFIKLSWDITEPITYLVTCCNLIIIMYFKKKIGKYSAFEYYTNKFFKNLIKRKKFDEKQFEEVRKKLIEVENLLNK